MGKFFSWIGDLIRSCVDGIIQFFGAIWDLVWSLICDAASYIFEFLTYCFSWIVFIIIYMFDWALVLLVEVLEVPGEVVNIDVSGLENLDSFATIAAVNIVIPLDTILQCWLVVGAVLVTHVIYCFIKSWIPTLSGR